jgi:squalene-hopene/tetraprenyl-beta-curcumene cyclase
MTSIKERKLRKSSARAVLFLGLFFAPFQAGTIRAEEAVSSPWNPRAAAAYLDDRADWWLKWSGAARGQGTACISCHTSLPFALARPALGRALGEASAGAAEAGLLAGLNKRVANWKRIVAEPEAVKDPFQPFYSRNRKPSALGTEAVVNALVLVNQDVRRSDGVLSPVTRQALAHLWEQQQDNGTWLWLDFGLNPWENNGAYYGASLAALAVGMAGEGYRGQADVQPKLAALKGYLRTQAADQPLHHRLFALWASGRWPDSLAAEQKATWIAEVLKLQEADGGWSLPKLGAKTARNGAWPTHGSHPAGAGSDGYATGLAVLALQAAGVLVDEPPLRKARAWLAAGQQTGTWPAHYVNRARDGNTDIGHFMRTAATAFAALALSETPQPGPAPARRTSNEGD